MIHGKMASRKFSVLAVSALFCGFLLAGCDDYVQITRDPDLRIPKLATWAWRPAPEPSKAPDRDSRPVVSRDVISRGDTVGRDPDANSEAVRQRVKTAIEQTLASKGLHQISDPNAADFLVDYRFAVERRNATVPVGYGGYPGLACGPYGCWSGWGWGPTLVGYEHIRFRAGTIVLDFVQRESKHLVYRAVGEKHVNYNYFTLTQGDINGLVHHLLKDLRTHS
ncbi:MAG TPA: DUF4136 domain-containing protein [Candidatus Acidoferrum sp.]|nr:DUF4136 domain-containing protein [Candidatus Acidoferrum sp.]